MFISALCVQIQDFGVSHEKSCSHPVFADHTSNRWGSVTHVRLCLSNLACVAMSSSQECLDLHQAAVVFRGMLWGHGAPWLVLHGIKLGSALACFFCLIKIGLFCILSHFILRPTFYEVMHMPELKQASRRWGSGINFPLCSHLALKHLVHYIVENCLLFWQRL